MSPQPDVLRGLAAHKGFRGRGLLARFLYGLPTSTVGYRTLNARPVPDLIAQTFSAAIKMILNTPPAVSDDGKSHPHVLRLDETAWRVWKDFALSVEVQMRPGARFEHITDWAGKFPGCVARLAGLLHVAKYARERPESAKVNDDTMRRAIEIGEFLVEHALLVFDLMGADPEMDSARKVWAWIARNHSEKFTERDCWHDLRGTFKRVDDIRPALEILVETGHIFTIPTERTGPGPKGKWFRVHPTAVTERAAGPNHAPDDQDDQIAGHEDAGEHGLGHFGQSGHAAPDGERGYL